MTRRGRLLAGLVACILAVAVLSYILLPRGESQTIRIGSKIFPESYILAEITAQMLEGQGFEVQRKLGLGGTLIAFEALQTGSIDIYPEYTGTLSQAVLRQPDMNAVELHAALAAQDLAIGVLFGFNNSYAIAVAESTAASRNITLVSDLAEHPDLNIGFSLEFLNRGDGWPALRTVTGCRAAD